MKQLLGLILGIFCCNLMIAQDTDSLQNATQPPIIKSKSALSKRADLDSNNKILSVAPAAVDSFKWEYQVRKNAKRAGLYSALLPGLGQIYNKKEYWRAGIVYAAIGTGTGFIIYNYNEWTADRRELAYRQTYNQRSNPKLSFLDNNQLSRKQNYDKQNLDMSVLLTGVGYILQIIEAISTNHLKDFDISPNISMKFKTSPLPHHQVGVGLAFQIK